LLDAVVQSGTDHLLITGDLTEDGSDVQMRGLFSLLRSCGYDESRSLTVIPGNHDLYGFIYKTFNTPGHVVGGIRGLLSLTATARTLWDFRQRVATYSVGDYRRSAEKFTERFAPAFGDCMSAQSFCKGMPFVKLMSDDFVLVGIDSNFYMPRIYGIGNVLRSARRVIRTHDLALLGENLSGSTGWVDTHSLDTILSWPEVKSRRKIVLLHHCLYDLDHLIERTSRPYAMEMRLCNRDEVVEILQRHNVELVLHGHEHASDDYRLPGGIRVLNSGGAQSGCFHLIDVTAKAFDIRLTIAGESDSRSSHGREVVLP